MKKRFVGMMIIFCVALAVAFVACGPEAPKTIKIGINAPITGDIPKVGEGSKFAAQMWLADINASGGLEIGGKSQHKNDYRGRGPDDYRPPIFQAGGTVRRSSQ